MSNADAAPITDPNAVPSYVAAAARGLMQSFGGLLVAKGAITGAQENDLIGGALVIFGFAWSFWQKRHASQRLKAAAAAPAGKPL